MRRNLFKQNFAFIAAGIGALLLMLVSQAEALRDLWQAWQTEEYSHGIVVVLLAVLMMLHLLNETKPVLRPSWLGVPLLVAAVGLQLVAHFAAFDTAAEYGLIIGFTGLSLCFLGTRATSAMMPGIIYLLFAVPLPHLFQANLSQELQLLSSSLGVLPLDLAGIPVYQEGNIIDLGGYKLQVVEACNGLRYLFPLMSFGYLVALLLEGSWWKRILIFLSTIPIAIALNASRIAVIGITVDIWGVKMGEGFIHAFEGWTVFIFCLAILFVEMIVLQKIGKPGRFRYDYLSLPKLPLSSGFTNKRWPPAVAFILTFSAALLFASNRMERIPEIRPAHPPFAAFPLSIDAWRGQPMTVPRDVIAALQLSDYWMADYSAADAKAPVNLYIAYYDSQRIGTTTHSPSNCIPGGGWQIDNSQIRNVSLGNGINLNVTELLIRHGDETQLVDYWFQERGRDLTETTIAKWYLLKDALLMHRTDGALVRVSTAVVRDEPLADAEQRLNAFLTHSYPTINAFIPSATID